MMGQLFDSVKFPQTGQLQKRRPRRGAATATTTGGKQKGPVERTGRKGELAGSRKRLGPGPSGASPGQPSPLLQPAVQAAAE